MGRNKCLLLTHYEKQFDDNNKVSLCFRLDKSSGCPPVLHQTVHGQQEEDDVGGLEGDQHAVEVHELRGGEEGGPLAPGVVVARPLLAPRLAQEALGYAHVRPSYVAGTKLFNQSNNDAKNEWHTLQLRKKDDVVEC